MRSLWILDTPTERDAAALLLRRFQRIIQAQAAPYGWKVDSTADLARVLRPAGTLNHKSGHPKLVTILHEDAIRYNPSDIADASWLATIEDTYMPSMDNGHSPPTPLDPIVNGCAWLQHCRDDAATLPEPEWYGMLGILGRGVDGVQIAHEWSAPYPRYSKDETAKKLQHALQHGPLTCSTIRYDKGGEDYCRDCQHWGKMKSPIVLAMPCLLVSKGSQNGTTSTATPGQTVQDLDAVEVAQQAADTLLHTLPTLADDAKEDAILDALPALAPLDTIAWMRLKRQLKTAVPTLNLNDLAQARSELRRASTSQAPTPTGSAQAQIAAALAQEYAGQLAYETSRKTWMTYANGLWTPTDTEYIQQRIGSYMDTLLHGDYSWYDLAGVEHLLGRRLAQTLTLATPGWLPFRNGLTFPYRDFSKYGC
jgi:hypothetical protein